MRETKSQRQERTEQVIKLLKRAYPDAHCALNHSNAFELLVATILSAQCTDERVNIVTDRDSGQPRGFAFVEMTDRSAAETAIAQLNGSDLNGRAINVNEARPKAQGAGGGGHRGGGGKRW